MYWLKSKGEIMKYLELNGSERIAFFKYCEMHLT